MIFSKISARKTRALQRLPAASGCPSHFFFGGAGALSGHFIWIKIIIACFLTGVIIGLTATWAGAEARESLRLRITNTVGGAIEYSLDQGQTWERVGSVTEPAQRVNPNSYTAAAWAKDSHVAATAVNAIHIKIALNPRTGRPMTLSVVPTGEIVGAAQRQLSSAIVTDIPGGTSIFGGGLGPYVNSPVYLEPGHTPLPPNYEPQAGDVLLIIRLEPERLPYYAILENRVGGKIWLDYGSESLEIGVVDKPVRGIGRFPGTMYAWPSRIRANHPGVLEISTSPYGMIGGFQIIPRRHAQSPEMSYARTGPQWMIIGPPQGDDWAGQPPFFAEAILPSYRYDDIYGDYADWIERVLSRSLVQARFGEGPWEPMPFIAFSKSAPVYMAARSQRGRRSLWLIPVGSEGPEESHKEAWEEANHALEGMTHIRIVFPLKTFPPRRSVASDEN